jgi:hypothetical protein
MTEDLSYSFKGAEGSITFEFNIQVNRAGDLTLPRTTFAYFNPIKEKYIESATEPMILKIQQNPNFQNTSNGEQPLTSTLDFWGPMRNEIDVSDEKGLDFGSSLYWGLLGSPLFIAFLFGLWLRRKDMAPIQPEAPTRRSREEIITQFEDSSRTYSERNANFFSAIQGIVEKEINQSLKLSNMAPSTRELIVHQLIKHGATDAQISRYTSFMSTCENAQYGMGIEAIDAENLLNEARQFVLELHNA